jgi:hypothetical protein
MRSGAPAVRVRAGCAGAPDAPTPDVPGAPIPPIELPRHQRSMHRTPLRADPETPMPRDRMLSRLFRDADARSSARRSSTRCDASHHSWHCSRWRPRPHHCVRSRRHRHLHHVYYVGSDTLGVERVTTSATTWIGDLQHARPATHAVDAVPRRAADGTSTLAIDAWRPGAGETDAPMQRLTLRTRGDSAYVFATPAVGAPLGAPVATLPVASRRRLAGESIALAWRVARARRTARARATPPGSCSPAGPSCSRCLRHPSGDTLSLTHRRRRESVPAER